jgi:hypothetical protein
MDFFVFKGELWYHRRNRLLGGHDPFSNMLKEHVSLTGQGNIGESIVRNKMLSQNAKPLMN